MFMERNMGQYGVVYDVRTNGRAYIETLLQGNRSMVFYEDKES